MKAACCHCHCPCRGGTRRVESRTWGVWATESQYSRAVSAARGRHDLRGCSATDVVVVRRRGVAASRSGYFAVDVGLRAWTGDPEASPVTRIPSASERAERDELKLPRPEAHHPSSFAPALHSFTRHAAPVLLVPAKHKGRICATSCAKSQHARLASSTIRTIMTTRPSRPQA